MSRRDPHLLTGAYALHALNPEEAAEVEQAMQSSEDLRSEVAELTDTAVLLGLAAPPVQPSAAMRANIMSLLDATPQLPPLPGSSAQPASAAPTSIVSAPTHGAQPNGSGSAAVRAHRTWFMRAATMVAAAAAAVALFIGGAVVGSNLNRGDGDSQQASAFAALNASPDVRRSVTALPTGGTASLVVSPQLQRSAVVLNGVAGLDSGKTYQLWYVRGLSATSGGLVDPSRNNVYRVMDGTFQAGDQIAMTVEPAGGSTSPTSLPMLFAAAR